jgi:hypothetical protein
MARSTTEPRGTGAVAPNGAAGTAVGLVAIVIGTLLAAMAGGRQCTHHHRRIDRTGGIA